jgi:hypothetical protein
MMMILTPPIVNDDDQFTAFELKQAIRKEINEKAGHSISIWLSTVETFVDALAQKIVKSREYEHGEIVEDAEGTLWQRYNQDGKTGWVTFGDDYRYSDDYLKRPLTRIDMSE